MTRGADSNFPLQEEFTNTNFHRCTRFLEEYKAPFEDTSSAVYKAGLRLISAQQVLSPCVAQKLWKAKLDKGIAVMHFIVLFFFLCIFPCVAQKLWEAKLDKGIVFMHFIFPAVFFLAWHRN